MTKIQMPEPVAYLVENKNNDGFGALHFDPTFAVGDIDLAITPLHTDKQAEAYAIARVREALEEAEDAVTTLYEADDGPFLVEIARAIRALIPKEE